MVEERIVNILKRMSFKHFTIVDIDNATRGMVTAQLVNTVTETEHYIHFPIDMLERWYEYGILKYDLVKEYILSNISEDYHSTLGWIYE